MLFQRVTYRSVGAVAAVAAATMCVACSAVTHDPDAVAAARHTATAKVGSDDFYKITMTVKNNTTSYLQLSDAYLGHDSGGAAWEQRATDLSPGASETVSGYSPANGQAIQLTYYASAGHAKIVLTAQDPWAGSNNTNGTKGTSPFGVNASIGSGRQCTAAFTVYSA